jgi:EAL domain-containing protein (putative c-di-GMP-specific phosphodiesterase class I)/CheY-like chemotaxis protein
VHETVRLAVQKKASGSILLVEDDADLARSLARSIGAEGYRVVVAKSSAEALEAITGGSFDAVISDLNLPGASGVDVLSVVRAYDKDVPLIVMTGAPTVDTAIEAVSLGVLEYLVKPCPRDQLLKAVARASAVRRRSVMRREVDTIAPARESTATASLGAAFERALESLFVELEPVMDSSTRSVKGVEARVQSREETLPTQALIVVAAEALGRLGDLRRRARDLAVKAFVGQPPGTMLFIDVHTSDLLDSDLYSPDAPLSRIAGDVVLQIRGRGDSLSIVDLAARASVLRFVGFRIAICDLDGGDARLTQLAELSPDFVKIDAKLVRGLDRAPKRKRVVRALASMCTALGAVTVAEGVSTAEERAAVEDAGCVLVQGPLMQARLAPRSTPRPLAATG